LVDFGAALGILMRRTAGGQRTKQRPGEEQPGRN
jgi:hypothetical protein